MYGIDEDRRTILDIKRVSGSENAITYDDLAMSITNMKLFNCDNCLFVVFGPLGIIIKETFRYDHNIFHKTIDVCDEFVDEARKLDDDTLFYMVAFQAD